MTQLQVEEISVVVSVVNHLHTRIFTSLHKKVTMLVYFISGLYFLHC